MKEFVLSTSEKRVLAYKFNMLGVRSYGFLSVAIPECCANLIETQMTDIKLHSFNYGNERVYEAKQGNYSLEIENGALCVYVVSSVAEIKEM